MNTQYARHCPKHLHTVSCFMSGQPYGTASIITVMLQSRKLRLKDIREPIAGCRTSKV